ncbi:MAG: cupin domain-containing protein [Fretibacterium sp.]|nr:cupin domain-containing protein [Fretibacterium sp.]
MGQKPQKNCKNLFSFPEDAAKGPEEFLETLLQSKGVRVERILSAGHASAEDFWYDQEESEWVLLLQGSAELEFEGGERLSLCPGDWTWLPAHEKHRVARTSKSPPCVWLTIFLPSDT